MKLYNFTPAANALRVEMFLVGLLNGLRDGKLNLGV